MSPPHRLCIKNAMVTGTQDIAEIEHLFFIRDVIRDRRQLMWPYSIWTYSLESPCEMGVPKYAGIVVSIHHLHQPGRQIKKVRAFSRSFGEWCGTRTKSVTYLALYTFVLIY